MTDSQKLDLLLDKVTDLDKEVKVEMTTLKGEVSSLKGEVSSLKEELFRLKDRVASLELHIENYTDKSVQLLAENFIDLSNKLNQAIPVTNKNLAYEVKVNYLIEEVEQLKKNVAEILNKPA